MSPTGFSEVLSGELFLATDEGLDPFREENRVERFAERFIQNRPVEPTCVVVVGQESDLDDIVVLGIFSQILSDHQSFATSHGEVDDDAIGMERFSLNSGFETTVGEIELEIIAAHTVDESGLDVRFGTDEEDFSDGFVFKFPERHTVLFEESDEVFAWNPSVLRTGNTVSAEAAGIEPFADGSRGHFADLGYLTSSKDRLHRRLSNLI